MALFVEMRVQDVLLVVFLDSALHLVPLGDSVLDVGLAVTNSVEEVMLSRALVLFSLKLSCVVVLVLPQSLLLAKIVLHSFPLLIILHSLLLLQVLCILSIPGRYHFITGHLLVFHRSPSSLIGSYLIKVLLLQVCFGFEAIGLLVLFHGESLLILFLNHVPLFLFLQHAHLLSLLIDSPFLFEMPFV